MRPHHLSLLLALVVLANNVSERWRYAVAAPTTDFFILWGVPRALSIRPLRDFYTADSQEQMTSVLLEDASSATASPEQRAATVAALTLSGARLDAPGSPLPYAIVGSLSSGNYATDRLRFLVVCLVALATSVLLLGHLLRLPMAASILFLSIFVSLFSPVISDVTVGNINQIQLLLVTLFIFGMARSRPLGGGAVLGLAVMLKPNAVFIGLLVLVMWAVDRDEPGWRRLVVGAGSAVAASAVLTSVYFGTPSVWVAFARNLPRLFGLSYEMEKGNVGLTMLVASLTGRSISLWVLLLLLTAFTVVVARTRSERGPAGGRASPDGVRDGRSLHDAFAVVGIGSALMIFASKLAWLHYYVLLIPTVMYLLRPLADDIEWRPADAGRRLLAVAALFLLTTAVGSRVSSDLRYSALINAAAGVMVLLQFYEIWLHRSARASSPRGGEGAEIDLGVTARSTPKSGPGRARREGRERGGP